MASEEKPKEEGFEFGKPPSFTSKKKAPIFDAEMEPELGAVLTKAEQKARAQQKVKKAEPKQEDNAMFAGGMP